MSYLIKNGTIVTAEKSYKSDILIDKEMITDIGNHLSGKSSEIIDAEGLYIFPGGVDAHTHIEMPYMDFYTTDDYETGTRAAAFGGTTTIIDFINPEKGEQLNRAFDSWHTRACGKAVVDFGFHMTLVDFDSNIMNQLEDIINKGVTSFKVFTDYPGRLMIDDEKILKILKWSAQKGTLVLVHAIDGPATQVLIDEAVASGKTSTAYHGHCRPTNLEGQATARVLALAGKADAPVYIVHMSCTDALDAMRKAREKGVYAFGETCPQYLFLDQSYLELSGFEGAKYVCNPPLRDKIHQKNLWEAIKNQEIQTVATDHCPFNFQGHKDIGKNDFRKIPNGLPGIETRLALMFQGVRDEKINMNQFVNLVSTMPAKIFNLFPQKGSVSIGADADLVLWNPDLENDLSHKNLHMRVDYSLYESMKIKGKAEKVFLRGKLIVDGDKFLGKGGDGKFIVRKTKS